jgi:hypothetical protein
VTDNQFINYLVSDLTRETAVLSAPKLVTRFQKFRDETDDGSE